MPLLHWPLALTLSIFSAHAADSGVSVTPEELCQGGESILHESREPLILTYCERGQIVRREIFFKNSKQISSLQLYENGHLSEQISYSTSGNMGSKQRFKFLGANHWIREKIDVYGDDAGSIESREELINFNPYEGLDLDYQVIKRWFFSLKPHFHVEYVDLYSQEDQKRPFGKETYSDSGELLSVIKFTYEGSSEKPIAFTEEKLDGSSLEYALYEPFTPEETWANSDLDQVDIQKRRDNLKSQNRFKFAIIDSGYDYNHIELAHQWWQNPLDPLDGIDNDGNGWVDDVFGWEQVRDIGLPTESSTSLARDQRPLSHGTHVAHIATRDLFGAALIGFAGDYTRPSYIKKISEFIKTHQIKIVNMSLGLPSDIRNNMGLRDAVNAYKKMVADNPQTLFVFAAGNSAVDIDEYSNRQWPANIKGKNTLTVGALNTDHLDPKHYDSYELAYYSNFGVKNVDILAPGTGIEAASLGGGLIKHSGTSMASPFMVNLALKLWMEFPTLLASEVREIFIESAYQMSSKPKVLAGGFANLQAARELAKKFVIEKRAKKIEGKKTVLSGPNCWNSALYMSGVNKGIHHTTGEEFRFLIESPLCKRVESPQLGDVIALRRVSKSGSILRGALFSEVHAYTYLESDQVLSKNGTDADVAYEKTNLEEVFNFYQRADKRACKISGIPREHCNLIKEYYRCHSLAESFEDPAVQTLYQKVVALEERVGEGYFLEESRVRAQAFKSDIQNSVDQLQEELASLIPEGDSGPNNALQFLSDYLEYRLASTRVTQF